MRDKFNFVVTAQGISTAWQNQKPLHRLKVWSPGQTDSQVVASSHKLNLRRDLRWVAKRTRKFSHKYTQVAKKKKNILGRHFLYFIG